MSVRLAHFYALRAHIDALIVAEESEQGIPALPDPGSCPNCGAGDDKQIDRSTLDGTKRKKCSVCGVEWNP